MAPPVQTSVWVGMVTDHATLEAALEVDESPCDGDALGSAFSRAAGQPVLGPVPRELKVLSTPTSSTSALLEGLSFRALLEARLPADTQPPCNAIVVFYGAVGSAGTVELEGVRMRALLGD